MLICEHLYIFYGNKFGFPDYISMNAQFCFRVKIINE